MGRLQCGSYLLPETRSSSRYSKLGLWWGVHVCHLLFALSVRTALCACMSSFYIPACVSEGLFQLAAQTFFSVHVRMSPPPATLLSWRLHPLGLYRYALLFSGSLLGYLGFFTLCHIPPSRVFPQARPPGLWGACVNHDGIHLDMASFLMRVTDEQRQTVVGLMEERLS